MTKTFTQNDLIRYIYHETTEEEGLEIDRALSCDSELHLHYQELVSLKTQLDQSHLEPSDAVVNRILEYSKSFPG